MLVYAKCLIYFINKTNTNKLKKYKTELLIYINNGSLIIIQFNEF